MPNNRSIDAGRLNEPVEILALRETEPTVWAYVPAGRAWAAITLSEGRNLFSQVGVGARDAAVILRRVPLTLDRVLRWRGGVLWPTSIVPMGRGHLEVHAAVVAVDTVRLRKDETTQAMTFPGVLTEKYARHTQEWPMSVNDLGLVLVVPKPVTLRPGTLVEGRGALWEVLVPHELDPHKNEYEIGRTVDL